MPTAASSSVSRSRPSTVCRRARAAARSRAARGRQDRHDEVVNAEACFAHELAQRGRAAQPPEAGGGKAHERKSTRPRLLRCVSMASPRAYSGPLSERATRRRRSRTARRWTVVGLLVGTALIVTILLAAFSSPSSVQACVSTDSALLETGRPLPHVIAFQGDVRIQLPGLVPVGHRARLSRLQRQRAAARAGRPPGERGNLRAHRSPADRRRAEQDHVLPAERRLGAADGALDVGAPAGTAVYAPVDGTVVSIRDVVIDGKRRGHRIDVVPNDAPSVVVSIRRLRADPALTVGSPVTSGTSKIGIVLDLSKAEEQALADVTNDPGNHVTIEVRPAANLGT